MGSLGKSSMLAIHCLAGCSSTLCQKKEAYCVVNDLPVAACPGCRAHCDEGVLVQPGLTLRTTDTYSDNK
jgi:hypothetical protein